MTQKRTHAKAGDRVVAFVDILGFRELVGRMFLADNDLFTRVVGALQSLNEVQGKFMAGGQVYHASSRHTRVTSFSDTTVISKHIRRSRRREITDIPPECIAAWDVIERAAWLACALLPSGILVRGGIAIGPTYHRGRIVVGPGMIRAYDLESTVARYPRIVVGDEVVAALRTWTHRTMGVGREAVTIPNDPSDPMPQLRRDFDGCWYIDVFYHMYFNHQPDVVQQLQRIRAVLEGNLCAESSPQHRDLGRLAKYRWLAAEFNRMIHQYRELESFYRVAPSLRVLDVEPGLEA